MADKLKISGLYNPRVNEAPLYELKIGTKTTEEENNVVYRWVMCKVGVRKPISSTIKRKGVTTKFGITPDMAGKKYDIVVYECTLIKDNKTNEDNKTIEDISEKISNDDLENVLKNGHKDIKVEFVDKKTIEIPEEKTTRHNITPEIEKVYLSKKGSGNISKVSYQDTLIATAKTKGLEGKKITFNLYERDEKDKTHVKDFFAEVDRYGIASVEIPLLSNKKVFQLLANQKAPEYGEGNKHEFFVMASFGLNKTIKESNELQVNLTKKIKKAYFVDVNGKKVNKIQVGDSVCVRIESEDMIGAWVRYTILEKDVINDDEIWVRKLIINDDIHTDGKITITKNLFNEGADLGYVDSDSEKQNYYIKVEALVGKEKSSAFELSFKNVELEVSKSPVKVKVGEVKKEEKKKKEEPLEEGVCPHCRKKHIDLRSKIKFKSQGKGNLNCNLTCKEILSGIKEVKKDEDENKQVVTTTKIMPEGAGIKSKAYPNDEWRECEFQLADENKERNKLIFRDIEKINKAYEYLDKSLEHGLPVMVGVNHTFNYKPKDKIDKEGKKYKDYINETTTDHYVVIVGRECDNGSIKYRFWDVGSSKGNNDWFFEKQEDGIFTASKTHNSKKYTITQIRRNLRIITEEITNKKTNEKTKKTKNKIITY